MTTTFDPASWVEKAEVVGLGVHYVYSGTYHRDGRYEPTEGLAFMMPDGEYDADDELSLWYELRPTKAAAEKNEQTLADYLLKTGRTQNWRRLNNSPAEGVAS